MFYFRITEKLKRRRPQHNSMQKRFNQLHRSPLLAVLNPVNNFSRASPLLWIFLAAVVLFFLGINVEFFRLFAWIGGFLVVFFVAVGLALFEAL